MGSRRDPAGYRVDAVTGAPRPTAYLIWVTVTATSAPHSHRTCVSR